jgi:hypothetical protein
MTGIIIGSIALALTILITFALTYYKVKTRLHYSGRHF